MEDPFFSQRDRFDSFPPSLLAQVLCRMRHPLGQLFKDFFILNRAGPDGNEDLCLHPFLIATSFEVPFPSFLLPIKTPHVEIFRVRGFRTAALRLVAADRWLSPVP